MNSRVPTFFDDRSFANKEDSIKKPTKKNKRKSEWDDYLQLRNDAMEIVADNAELSFPDFSDRACDFIVTYILNNGATPGETLTDACKEAGIVPHDDRAFGPVYMKLSRQKKIVVVGTAVRKKGHGTSGGNVWDVLVGSGR